MALVPAKNSPGQGGARSSFDRRMAFFERTPGIALALRRRARMPSAKSGDERTEEGGRKMMADQRKQIASSVPALAKRMFPQLPTIRTSLLRRPTVTALTSPTGSR